MLINITHYYTGGSDGLKNIARFRITEKQRMEGCMNVIEAHISMIPNIEKTCTVREKRKKLKTQKSKKKQQKNDKLFDKKSNSKKTKPSSA
jgi:hypothetical protein